MTFMQAYEQMWLNFSNFRGRASRAAYWKAMAINLVLSIIFLLTTTHSPLASAIADLYSIAAFIPVNGHLNLHRGGHLSCTVTDTSFARVKA